MTDRKSLENAFSLPKNNSEGPKSKEQKLECKVSIWKELFWGEVCRFSFG